MNTTGTNGDDTVTGTASNDNLNGGAGSDTLYGGDGSDKLSGGSGNDILDGGSGSDVLNGDSGNDTLIYNLSQNVSTSSNDVYTGGSGIDTVLMQLTSDQWSDPAVRLQLEKYVQQLATVKANPTGEVSNGAASDFTFIFANGTKLTVSMMETLKVAVLTGGQYQVIDHLASLVTGTNSGTVIEAGGVANGNPGAPTVSGDLYADDLNGADDAFIAVLNPTASAHSYGTYTVNANGVWSFNLDNANLAVQKLNAGEHLTDSFSVKAADGTETTVQVTINGTNDAAQLSSAVVALDETDAALTTGGQLTISDVDSPETFQAQTGTAGDYGKFSIGTDGQWSYTADSAFDTLNVGDALTDSFSVKAADGTETTVQVTINGTNDAAQLSSTVVALDETDAALTTGGQLTISDVDSPETFQAQTGTAGDYGKFSIGTDGQWSYTADSAFDTLNVGDALTDSFSVKAADGTETTVQVTINGTNDAAQLSSAVVALDETDAALTTGGQLTISDVDSPETFQAQTGTAGDYGKFSIGTDGQWSYTADSAFDTLNVGDALTDSFSVKAADGTETTVQVTINGTNDAAQLSSAVVALDETDAALTTGGQLTISDVDSPETFQAQTGTAGDYGKFSIGTDGQWSYTADSAFDTLNVGDALTDSFSVKAADGTETTVQVTINGTNDAAQLSSAVVALDETDAALTTGGQLTISDVDSPETFQAQTGTAGDYGKFSIGTDGQWSYTADSAFDTLNVGDALTDSFSVKAADGTETTVQVTINGTNDAAQLSSAVVALDETDAALTTGGQLTISDVDSPETFQAQTGTAGDYGKFSIGTDGQWSYTADSAFDTLNVGDALTDSFSVKAADGTETTVQVTINGTNDAAQLSSAVVALDETDAALTTGGQLTISDVDSPETFQAQTGTAGDYGKFSIGTDGQWSYTADSAFDTLNVGDALTDSFSVKAADGTETTVQVTINGTNDAAQLSSAVVALDETDAALTTGGQLTISDVDSPETFQAQTGTAGDYGKFSIGTDGQWSYTADSAFDTLNVGDALTDSFSVKAADGTETTVQVTINGTADGPAAAPSAYNGNDDLSNFDNIDSSPSATVINFSGTGNTQDSVHGSNSADNISGGGGADTIYGNGGNDTLNGDEHADTIYGGSGADTITGGNQNDTIYGGSGGDTISGNDQQDILYGGSGTDTINGNAGNDQITGGFGADILDGGAGSDTFFFLDVRDTGDSINNYSVADDTLNFNGIDANSTLAGNQNFAGATQDTTLTSHGVIWFYDANTGQTIVQADTDGNVSTAEFQIQLTGNINLTASDFVL